MTRTLYIESAEALQNLENECEGFAEVYDDDGEALSAADCRAARDWLASLREHDMPCAVHVPADWRHTINDAIDNLSEHDEPPPGAWRSFDWITRDSTLHRLNAEAPEGPQQRTRYALVQAFNALETVGADAWALDAVAKLLAQAGCVDGVDGRPMLGARDEFLTSVCDVAIYG